MAAERTLGQRLCKHFKRDIGYIYLCVHRSRRLQLQAGRDRLAGWLYRRQYQRRARAHCKQKGYHRYGDGHRQNLRRYACNGIRLYRVGLCLRSHLAQRRTCLPLSRSSGRKLSDHTGHNDQRQQSQLQYHFFYRLKLCYRKKINYRIGEYRQQNLRRSVGYDLYAYAF